MKIKAHIKSAPEIHIYCFLKKRFRLLLGRKVEAYDDAFDY